MQATVVEPQVSDQSLKLPAVQILLQSWVRDEFILLLFPLWPTVQHEGSTYNSAEPNVHSRNLRAKTQGIRVRTVV